ncbi:sodium-dependent multivitamin transporter-like isoform X2 [Haliotis rubra]|uniref:sodium-dependent multivitamin transporter-like isoform X2 n=1 Tax=Haliotis rubra TaxID=36100 RepID=UPI001EE503A5|nr:sodium-dependent multivitamin transporter-like isoform X2 [Haliotis rubra]XP_046571798.1 sodium-dependent multivitamin transporter-like isoform X2 [Haliotis rubra]
MDGKVNGNSTMATGSPNSHMFHIADYAMFGATLLISLGIGIFQAFRDRKKQSMSEYLVAGRKMAIIPVAVSLLVSFESSILMLGMPAEAYVYGIQYLIGTLGFSLAILLAVYMVVPVIHPLKLTSAYEYLELRFKSRLVRTVGSVLGIISYVWYMGVVLFGPALALEAVTGFSQWSSIFMVAAAAVIYTSIGGLKAVIWTDVFQAVIMFTGVVAILIKGTVQVGGPSEVWRRANNGGRNNLFKFDLDPTVRHTFWNLFIGEFLHGLALIFNQSSVQRISSTNSLKAAKTVMYLVGPGFLITYTLAVMEGVVAYSYYDYHQCDPLVSKQISNPNQVIPFMVMDIFRGFPGIPGLFLAALFSASLSTISSGLSSLSALTWKDFVQPIYPELPQHKAILIAKFSVVGYGVLACCVSLLAARVGGPLTQIGTSLLSASSGPLAGVFIVGSLTSIANKKGVITGALVSFVLVSWISIGANFSPTRRTAPKLPPASTESCPAYLNSSLVYNTTANMYTLQHNVTTASIEVASPEPLVDLSSLELRRCTCCRTCGSTPSPS